MVYHLMRYPSVVLQDVVVFCPGCEGELFRDGLVPTSISSVHQRQGHPHVLTGRACAVGLDCACTCSSGLA